MGSAQITERNLSNVVIGILLVEIAMSRELEAICSRMFEELEKKNWRPVMFVWEYDV